MTYTVSNEETSSRILWQGEIRAVQCRAWVWRYVTDNRTHHHLGFNIWAEGEAAGHSEKFIVAISDTQHGKLQPRIGDVVKGTAWPCKQAKHEIADFYRAGGLKLISRPDAQTEHETPPFSNPLPLLEEFEARGARMLDQKRWRKACMTCMWANKSAVEIEYNFDTRAKRYRNETFCYGPKSCPLYKMGAPRPVPYYGRDFTVMDDGGLDDCCTGHRDYDE